MHEALSALGATAVPEVKHEPAVSLRSSVKPDYIVCLEDGKKLNMLRRGYLSAGLCCSQRPARSIAATPEFEQRQAGTGPVGQAIGRVPGIDIKRTTMAHEESKIFSPLKIGEKTVKNRMVVEQMRRHSAALSGVPTALHVEYYRQRDPAGLDAPD